MNIHAGVVLNADVATAWRVLTDYGRYAEFIPDLHLSRIVARHGATVTVEQSGECITLAVQDCRSISPSRSTRARRTACNRAQWQGACARSRAATR